MSDTTRRAVLAGAAGITAVTVLVACGDDEGTDDSPGGVSATTDPGPTGGATAGPTALAKTADIPVNGGKIVTSGGSRIVITQPTAGDFKAFDGICTHEGCPVSTVTAGTIICNCHDSRFSAADGSVRKGPAKRPLAPKGIKVEGDSIVLA